MRQDWGENFVLKSFLNIYMLQGFLMVIISLPILLTNYLYSEGLNFLDNLGLFLWSFGFVFETLADYQLSRFLKDSKNKGEIMTKGLWKFSRHPNYFGEATMWWGIFFIALSTPYGYLTMISPILMTYLLLFVSGVPLLEKKYENNKKYQKYAKKTPKFFPWCPKK
jgi:steroid 5-alpha reductase family enzyme